MFHEFIYELGCTKVPDVAGALSSTVSTMMDECNG